MRCSLLNSCLSFGRSRWREHVRDVNGWALALIVGVIVGCGKAPAPDIDPAKAPWLDPKAQIEGLTNQDFRIRGISAFNLGNMGAKAVDALPILDKLAKDDPHPKVREKAQEAIDKIRPKLEQQK